MTPAATPAVALEAIECVCEEALDASAPVLDQATLNYTQAVVLVHLLRFKLQEIRACVAETRVALPPGPLCSAAVAVIRDELRRELSAG